MTEPKQKNDKNILLSVKGAHIRVCEYPPHPAGIVNTDIFQNPEPGLNTCNKLL